MSLPSAKTFCRHSSPASHAITRASIAEKSATISLRSPWGMNAVRISCDKVSGLDRRAQAEMQAWIQNEAGGNGMGESVPTPEKSKCQYDDGKLLQII